MPYVFADGSLRLDAFSSLTLAILLLFIGKGLAARIGMLRRYGIPDPVVGGVLCAGVACILYYAAGLRLEFELGMRMVVAFTAFVVFPAMGRDYEAAVICSGFGGIALGSTATAVANMTAVAREYGAAPKAFLVVPLVCGFVIDLVNALVIGLLAR